jgi:large-conductance mechanosensitive channel
MSINFNSKTYIKSTIIITALAAISSELLSSLSTHILIPLIDGDCNNDGKLDINHNLKSKKTKIGKKVIHIGEFLYTMIKFILIVIFLLLIRKLL